MTPQWTYESSQLMLLNTQKGQYAIAVKEGGFELSLNGVELMTGERVTYLKEYAYKHLNDEK